MTADGLDGRLEMLLVARWLEEGLDDRGELTVPVGAVAGELGLSPGREGLLAVMAALGALEERGAVAISWPSGAAGGEALVVLDEALRRDARRLFGRS